MSEETVNWLEKRISTTGLKEGKKSTRDLIHYYTTEKERKKHFDFGNSLELYIVDQKQFWDKVAILDESKRPEPDRNYQVKVNKEWKDQFHEDNADKYIINQVGDDSFEAILILEAMLKKHPKYNMIFEKMVYQPEFIWNDPLSGLKRYCRPDLASAELGRIIDMKTDGNNDPHKALRDNDHFLQAVDHIKGAENSNFLPKGHSITEYFWVFFGKKKPYFVDIIELDLDYLNVVENVYNQTHKRLKRDFETGAPENIVFHKEEIERVAPPPYYK